MRQGGQRTHGILHQVGWTLCTDPIKQGLACGKSIRPTSENILYTSVVSTERISSGLVLPSTIQTRPSEKGLPQDQRLAQWLHTFWGARHHFENWTSDRGHDLPIAWRVPSLSTLFEDLFASCFPHAAARDEPGSESSIGLLAQFPFLPAAGLLFSLEQIWLALEPLACILLRAALPYTAFWDFEAQSSSCSPST